MIDINNNTQWKKHKEKMEVAFKEIGEYPRINRCNKTKFKFTGVVLEGGLNIRYSVDDRSIIVWGVGKRYSNGYISYEQLKKKVELFEELMKDCY